MSILVFGRTGQVAHALQQRADVTALDRVAADLADPAACAAAIHAHRPDVVINAAAYTAVDRAEEEPELAKTINEGSPTAMAHACADLDVPFLHISTDYVFEGSGTAPWGVDDPIAPLGVYGATKAAGEAGVRAAGGRHAILRTSWVFSAHGANFVKTMLRLSDTRDTLNVVEDQIGGPTPAGGIADTVLRIAERMQQGHAGGIYHYAGAPAVSWAEFARAIFTHAHRPVTVHGIPATDYPTPALRPANSRMNCSTLETDFGIPPADWHSALGEVLKEILQ